MHRRQDNIRAWVGSILLHVLLCVSLLLWEVGRTTAEPEFIELSWGAVAKVSPPVPPRAGLPGSEGAVSTPAAGSRVVDLPERKFPPADEVIRVPDASKMEAEERPAPKRGRVPATAQGTKDRGAGAGVGSRERFASPGIGEHAGAVADPLATGPAGSDAGSSVSVSMTWSDGGTRKKVSGDLPEYPEGVRIEAQIRIEAVVLPDGSVKSLKPAQKGNTKLEEAAMKAVRLWRFEPLRRSAPQRDQLCTITFNFRLQ